MTSELQTGVPNGKQAPQSLRILMAEDNQINQRVGKLILQRAGYVIDLVSDGHEAVEAHRSQPYDLILMGLVTIFTLVSVSLYLVEWVRHMSTIEAK